MLAIRCDNCGGSVAVSPDHPHPRCLFCDSDVLTPIDPSTLPEPPNQGIPFVVEQSSADGVFRKYAASSIWYPGSIRQAKVELSRLMVPAWLWKGHLETHWAGLIRASTQSGKAPRTGIAQHNFEQVLVPSSAALTVAELRALGTYDEDSLQAWDPESEDIPYELAEVSRSAAQNTAVQEMKLRHKASIKEQQNLLSLNINSLSSELSGFPTVLPIWIGVFRYKDVPYRVVINGQTGQITGKIPLSVAKILLAVFGGLFLLAAIIAVVMNLA